MVGDVLSIAVSCAAMISMTMFLAAVIVGSRAEASVMPYDNGSD
jgi:hypothetical protein